MDNSELDKKIDEMWSRVSGKPLKNDSLSLPDDVRESNFETIQFLKNNFAKAEDEWRSLLESKERTISDLNVQLDEMRAHLKELKQHYKSAREKLVNSELQMALKLEETQNILREQKKSHQAEVRLLKEVLERSKNEIRELAGKVEKLSAEKAALEKELAAEREKHRNVRDTLLGLENKLDESKKAVEETLGELLSERKAHSETRKKSADLENRVKELREEIKSIRENWSAERKEWRELWERERSVWETHRHEFALWEEKLRKERELWTERIREEEHKDIEYASRLASLLKETSAWSEKVTQILKLYALKGVELPKVFVSPERITRGSKRAVSRLAYIALSSLLAFGGLAYWVHDYRSKAHFTLLSQHSVSVKNPTSLSVSGAGIWISGWSNEIVLRDAKDFALLRRLSDDANPLRPQDVEAEDGYMWILDMSQLRFVKKDDRYGNTLLSVKTPGPAPQALAFDGFNLWSYDASTGLLYRHSMDPGNGIEASFDLGTEGSGVLKMQWVGGELWVLSKGKLSRYEFRRGAFRKISEQGMDEGIISFAVGKGNAWFLSKMDGGKSFEILKEKIKIYGK